MNKIESCQTSECILFNHHFGEVTTHHHSFILGKKLQTQCHSDRSYKAKNGSFQSEKVYWDRRLSP